MTNETKKAIEVLKEAFDGDWLQPRTIDALNHVIQLVRDTSELLENAVFIRLDSGTELVSSGGGWTAMKPYGGFATDEKRSTTALAAFKSLKSKS